MSQMKRWIYIQAVVTMARLAEDGPGAIRFRKLFVNAEDESSAYTAGQRLWADIIKPSPKTETINDWVIAIPDVNAHRVYHVLTETNTVTCFDLDTARELVSVDDKGRQVGVLMESVLNDIDFNLLILLNEKMEDTNRAHAVDEARKVAEAAGVDSAIP